MSEVEQLRTDVAALRGEVEKWKAIVVDVLGKASRAQGFAEGVGEGANMQLDALNGRVTLLESRQNMRWPSQSGLTPTGAPIGLGEA